MAKTVWQIWFDCRNNSLVGPDVAVLQSGGGHADH
jgi:hypothetical protein